jgi:two-component system, chemotaxis family, response regulator Rcp1
MSLLTPPTTGHIRVLMIEDNREDAVLIKIAFDRLKRPLQMTLVDDGQAAVAYLKDGKKLQARSFDIIFLDLNIPGKPGLEVLAEIRSDPAFDEIPVIILTGSDLDEHIRGAYDSRANFYLQKPQNLDGFLEAMRHVEAMWLKGRAVPVLTGFEKEGGKG